MPNLTKNPIKIGGQLTAVTRTRIRVGVCTLYSSVTPAATSRRHDDIPIHLTDSASQFRMDVDCDDAPFELTELDHLTLAGDYARMRRAGRGWAPRRGRAFCCGRTRVSGVVSTVDVRCVRGAVMWPEEVEVALVLRRDQHVRHPKGT